MTVQLWKLWKEIDFATEKVLGEETDKLPLFSSDRKFLHMLNKNIYHRKPTNVPNIFVDVCLVHTYAFNF